MLFLKISTWKGVMRFEKKGKLNPRYIGPFEVLERVGKTSYTLALPPKLSHVHNVLHVSMLRNYIRDHSHIINHEPIEIHKDLSYDEASVQILERKEKQLRSKTIALVKVLLTHQATWKLESVIGEKYPHLFKGMNKFLLLSH